MFRIIVSSKVRRLLSNHVCATNFHYETGGVLLGHRFRNTFYITGITFPKSFDGATMTSFVLDGEEHAEIAERIIRKSIPHMSLIGVWHSHTIEDNSLSLQDEHASALFMEQIGKILSLIVTPQIEDNAIQLNFYCLPRGCRDDFRNPDFILPIVLDKMKMRRETCQKKE